jgi:signal transduction histidine kinase
MKEGQTSLVYSQGVAVVEKLNGTYPKFPDRTSGYLQYFSEKLDSRLILLDNDKKVINDSFGEFNKGLPITVNIVEQASNDTNSQIYKTDSFGYVQYTLLKLSSDNGFLLIIKDINSIYKDITDFKNWVLRITAIIVSIFFVLSYFISFWFTKPISDLISQLRQITPHRREFKMKYKSKDEIGNLINTISVMVNQLSKYEVLQRQFISSSSHELKTPLATIQLISENLSSVKYNEELFDEFINDLTNQVNKMKKIISQLLDLHKDWDKKINRSAFDISLIKKHILEQFEYLAESKQIRFRFDIDQGHIHVDKELFLKGLDNLISNALRYTPNGGEVSVAISNKDTTCRIVICDSGIGIQNQDLIYIFEPFYRSNDAIQWNSDGSGLGLTIVKQMVELHEGEIFIQSYPNNGTCVEIIFNFKNDTKN